MNKFNIGDEVYFATYAPMAEVWIECPECAGKLKHEIILGCGEHIFIDCASCGPGYMQPTGKIRTWEPRASAEKFTVTGFEIRDGKVRYYSASGYIYDDLKVFTTYEEALARAEVLAEESREYEKKKIKQKEKEHRNWSWNASHHRQEIKRQEKSIDYHKAKLHIASLKAKEG